MAGKEVNELVDLVSIIVPFFNRIPLVIRCLNSVDQQSYPNIEVIVIDDASSEDSAAVEAMCKERSHWHYLRNLKNYGVSYSRNIGLDAATGSWISFLDSDDFWLKDKVACQVKSMQNKNLDASHTDYLRCHEGNYDSKYKMVAVGRFSYTFPWILFSCRIATPTLMLRAEFLSKGRFDPSLNFMEDQVLWVTLAKKARIEGLRQNNVVVCTSQSSSANHLAKYQEGMAMLRRRYLMHSKSLFLLHYTYSFFVILLRKYFVRAV